MSSHPFQTLPWDLFCQVVDNYGDIGVCWRLARQLANEYSQPVRLWVDDLATLCHICPQANPDLASQWLENVAVYHWHPDVQLPSPSALVIEAFGCQLPAGIIAQISHQQPPPLWINLEYLSAQDWVEGCHRLPSPQPGGLGKYFFFPGFTPATGGLLREGKLLQARRAFQAAPQAQADFLGQLGVRPQPGQRLISLFCYENPNLAPWLDGLAQGAEPSLLLVPTGRIVPQLSTWAGTALGQGQQYRRGALQVAVLPFISQADYDRLLWCCDLNLVRGEDSFVRAQWAGRPFVWHIYPQQQQTHLDKLTAFMSRYQVGLSSAAGQAFQGFWQAWNTSGLTAGHWHSWTAQWAELHDHAEGWCQQLAAQPDLAHQLLNFAASPGPQAAALGVPGTEYWG